MRFLIKQRNLVYLASVDKNGVPSVSPRFVLGLLADDELLFADAYKNKTLSNIMRWPNVSVVAIDSTTLTGYQIKGKVRTIQDEKIFNLASTKLKEFGFKAAALKVWAVKVNSVFPITPAPSKPPAPQPYG